MALNPGQLAGGNSAYGRHKSDFYPTPPEATRALMQFLKLPARTVIWEPACGEGHMVNEIKRCGCDCIGSDISQGYNFLDPDLFKPGYDWIITNPPFSLAEQFIRQAASTGKPFAFLLKSNYWQAKKRVPLFRELPPQFILPLTWRVDFTGGGDPLMDVAWMVWTTMKTGNTQFIPLEKPYKKGDKKDVL